MKNTLARIVSILGHPAFTMPAAAWIAAQASADNTTTLIATLLAAACALAVMGYSFIKTRTGHWQHIDASEKSERAELIRATGFILLLLCIPLAFFKLHLGISLAIGLCGFIICAAQLFSGIAKPSLHLAFGLFASAIVWPNLVAFTGLWILSAGIAWSRLALKRHTPLDLVIGAALGLAAGMVFQWLMQWL